MDALLFSAVDAALAAGAEILKIYNDPKSDFKVERKADNSPLTIADKKANSTIVGMLRETNLPVLTEEGEIMDYARRKEWKRFWMVDPLDGTKEFIKHNGEFTVNIALIEEGAPTLGVVYVPVSRTLYYGSMGEGAWRMVIPSGIVASNAREIQGFLRERLPLKRNNKEEYVVVASRSHLNAETEGYIRRVTEGKSSVRFISCGSSVKICRVAEGTADIYPRFAPTMEWDTAAGHAIVRAAGKQIYETDEKTPLKYNKEDLHNPYFICF